MKRFRLAGFALLVALAALMAGCQKSSEQLMEEVMSGKKHELPPKVTLATEPASVSVGEVLLKARVTDVDGRVLGEKARVRFLYWKAYEKVPSTPEEIVREAPEVVREGDQTYRTKVKLEKAGVWKVSVKLERAEKEPALATFALDVRG
ncbi:MAG: hypothetical protein HY726_12715 [Candidatus Rokubacteria bacterium]|nr:hypothetical protein [Candidatus Rokubacteria bacterium]